jgi:hypothetical protein
MKETMKVLLSCLIALVLISCGGGGSTPPPTTLSVTPNSASVALGGTQQFTASSNSFATSATWSVNGTQGGNSTVGTIDGNGLYHAPASFPSPDTLTVTASVSSATANASLKVVYPNNNAAMESVPVKMGTSGGNSTDFVDSGGTRTCCSGTLGALVSRSGGLFILSNNHVLDKSDQGAVGDNIQQPGLVDNKCDVVSAPPSTSVGNLTQAAALKPSPCSGVCTGPAPSNVDAAIAAINAVNVDTSGSILDLGAASSSSIAAAPPSSTLAVPANVLAANEGVGKSGRSTGLTCSNLSSITTNVSVDYDVNCGGAKAFTATFSNQVIINGGNFSASGDSGSLVVTTDTARPVGLLYAGNSTSTTANPIQDVLSAFASGGTTTVVGGGDHAVSCQPTATNSSASATAGGRSASLTEQEKARVTVAQQKYANRLLQNRSIADVSVGASADNPQEGALLVTVHEPTSVPAQLDGVRTRVIYANVPAPHVGVNAINAAVKIKDAHANALMGQSGIQGVGVGVSDDNSAEPALVVYVISGTPHAEIPAVIDGMRTKIIEGDRFRAFGWGKETAKPACSRKLQANPALKAALPKLP